MSYPPRHLLAAGYRLQPNAWSCGPTALYNAFQAMGVRCALSTLANMSACTRKCGVSEAGLRGAAWYYGTDLLTEFCHTREYMKEAARLRSPMLLCVDRDSDGPYAHWIATVRATSRHIWIADSARPGPALRRLTWNQFLDRAAVVENGSVKYAFHPLVRRK